MKEWVKNAGSQQFTSLGYSQSFQDALLSYIFSNLTPENPVPFCVEFGFNSQSLEGGSGANVAGLVLKENWNYLLLDNEFENPEINLRRHTLTSKNITDVFSKYSVPKQPEYVSIDVDSIDLWLFRSILQEYRAMVFSVEYNANFPVDVLVTAPEAPADFFKAGTKAFGASLGALNLVAQSEGYSLLSVVPGLDLFFVRNDLIDDGSDVICFPVEEWEDIALVPYKQPMHDDTILREFLDYGVLVEPGGGLAASKHAGAEAARKYLGPNGLDRVWRASKFLGLERSGLARFLNLFLPKGLVRRLRKLGLSIFFPRA